MTRDWKAYYSSRPALVGRDNYLAQVGHTVRGQPIGEAQFLELLAQIREALTLEPTDVVLDVCCGNGLFTHRLAGGVASILGVDFTGELIAVARADHLAANVDYVCMNALDLGAMTPANGRRFTKILLFASLQHFTASEADRILAGILKHSVDDPVIFLGFVPDRSLRWNFYRTPRQRVEYLVRRLVGANNFGHWWSRRQLVSLAARHGFLCEFGKPPASLHAATYRFNATLRKAVPQG